MAKAIRVSSDDVTYHTLPGNTGSLRNDGAEIDDTIFGALFKSSFPGLINWGVSAQAFYKGFAGYQVKIRKNGTATAMTAEAMSLVSGKTYKIADATKEIWDRTNITILDNATPVADADIESINFLFGAVTFAASYTPTTPITVTGDYFPTTQVGKGQSYTLNQTSDEIETTDFDIAQANNGRRTFIYGLKNADLEVKGVYDDGNNFIQDLQAREELIMEVNPDGTATGSRARGFYRLTGQDQTGDVGALEEETAKFSLAVPDNTPDATVPFGWYHDPLTTLNQAVRVLLDAWESESLVYVQYLPDGVTGWKGQAVVTDASMAGALESMNEFNVTLQGTGLITAV